MRDAFHDDLDAISVSLVEMSQLANTAMVRATKAILEADLAIAEEVISEDERIDNLHHDLDARTLTLLARQQPVAGDLRTIVTSIRMSSDIERMGDLAHHIAKLARMRYPACAIPPELVFIIQEMGEVAQRIMTKTTGIITSRDTLAAVELEKDDDAMDKLHRKLFEILLDDNWSHGIETAIDMTLVGRYYERYADHAVSVARRVYFLVTGTYASDLA
ncbi:phosphate transport system protein [Candidatus Planktophila limnetica]|uniref:Phosphate-specific transport system accessory protein PhoU n=1 Tax=Candidatus Planktophila limnetica TaxID=573600 RepID=A0A249LDL7_9ACTN|nr:phosphate signaling complex protein PhoU [Candidatus Planktophila limnetica]ASY27208.1 phosphate transport system protein [Candidatus Planktophila limnetica]